MRLETVLTFAIPILTIIGFFLGRVDKSLSKSKIEGEVEGRRYGNDELIKYRLDDLSNKMDELLNNFKDYKRTIENEIRVAIANHEKMFHNKEGK